MQLLLRAVTLDQERINPPNYHTSHCRNKLAPLTMSVGEARQHSMDEMVDGWDGMVVTVVRTFCFMAYMHARYTINCSHDSDGLDCGQHPLDECCI